MSAIYIWPDLILFVVFSLSFKAQELAWVKEFYPSLFDELKEHASAGRFIPVGGTWVEMVGGTVPQLTCAC